MQVESPTHEPSKPMPDGYISVVDRSPSKLKTDIPILISSGWSGNPIILRDEIDEFLKSQRRVIALSFSGTRHSFSKTNYPALEVGKAEAILQLVIGKNIPQVDIVAHSEGAIGVVIAASLEPQRFRSLVLVDPAGFIGKDSFPKLAGRFSLKMIRDNFRLLYDSQTRRPLARFLKEGTKFALTHPVQCMQEASAIPRVQMEDLLKEIHTAGVRIAIVSGVDDPVFPMQRLQQVIKSNMIDGFVSVKGGHDELTLQRKYIRAAEQLLTNLDKK